MVRELRIVIVDDNEQTRQAIGQLLSLIDGVRVIGEAADGLQAIERCRESKPDCVLMDLNMPRMNGLEASKRLRAERPDVAVIMMSVDDTPGVRRSVQAAGIPHFLVKPLSLDILEGILRTLATSQVSV